MSCRTGMIEVLWMWAMFHCCANSCLMCVFTNNKSYETPKKIKEKFIGYIWFIEMWEKTRDKESKRKEKITENKNYI